MSLMVNIDVDDLERAVAFYTRAFELRAARRFGDDGIELLGAATPIYLLRKAPGSVATPASDARRDYARHWTPVHLDFVVDDLDAAVRRALDAGATLERAAQRAAWGAIALLADPFGHGFCLVEFSAAGYDAIATAC
jgi:predicted enzyme related to lactoylglutathione lyase